MVHTETFAENEVETGHYEDLKIVALTSIPMCGWNPHWGQLCEALRPFQIPARLGYGAYWHQTISNMLEDCIDDGIDWAITFDYDSMMTGNQLNQLIRRFGQNPHIDALAALQCKRGKDDVPLLTVSGKSVIEIGREPFQVTTAHFGMTLLRLDSLKKVPMPWFVGSPDENGSYRTLRRTDADIYFWHAWNKAGNSVYVDPQCRIGHLQPVVSVFDDQLKPKLMHLEDWRKEFKK